MVAVGYTSGDDRKANVAGSEMSGPLAWTGAADSHAIEAKVTGDAADRFAVEVDGTHEWGDGTGAKDVNLYRSAANVLKTDDTFQVGASNTIKLGAAGDTTIARTGADEITVNNLVVTGTLTADLDTEIPADLSVTTVTTSGNIDSGGHLAAVGDVAGATAHISGAATVGSVASSGAIAGTTGTYSGAITATNVTGSGTVQGATVTATGAVNGATAAISGAASVASLTSSGAITATNVTGSGTVQGATVTATGAVNGATAAISGAATVGSATCTGTLTIGADTNLYRSAADVLKTDDSLSVAGSAGITLGADVNLYRNAANVLKTDDSMIVAGDLTSSGDVNVGDDLVVTDAASIGGNCTITGTLTVGGTPVTGGAAPITDYVATDQTRTNSTTLTSTTLSFSSLVTTSTYSVEGFIAYTAGTSEDIKFKFDTVNGNLTWTGHGPASSATAATNNSINHNVYGQADTVAYGGLGESVLAGMALDGFLITSGSGTLTLTFAQNSAASSTTATVKAGSWIKLVKLS